MEIRKFYETIGSDYKDVEKRMGSEKLVVHFVGRFMQDKTFASLSEAMEKNDGEAAFRAAHTLKGVCSNLGFDRLREASSELTEALAMLSQIFFRFSRRKQRHCHPLNP